MALEEKELSNISNAVVDKVKQQNESQVLMAQHGRISSIKIRAMLLTGETIPNEYLSTDKKGRAIPTGHRGNLVDLLGANGNRYYNVGLKSGSSIDTKFKPDQMFEITFINHYEENDTRKGIDGNVDLSANPIKTNIFTHAYTEFLSTYTPNNYEKIKGLPCCSKPPSIQSIIDKVQPVHEDMNVLAVKKSNDDIKTDFENAMKKSIGLSKDDPLPDYETLVEEYPKEVERALEKANSNSDRASIIMDKSSISLLNPKGKGKVIVSKGGVETGGNIIHNKKPDVPMDVVGINTKEFPVNDFMPKGNVFMVHPYRLPKLDEILSIGLMAYRFGTAIGKLAKLIGDFKKLK